MKIGILECGHTMPEVEEKHGTFPDMFARLLDGNGFSFASYDVEFMKFPQSVSECDGWLLGQVKLNAWHQDQVLRLPEGARVLASNDFCANAALVYGDRALTVQPHPEFAGPIIGDYVKLRRGTADYGEDVMDQADARLAEQDSNAALAKQIATFFKQPREARHG